MSDFFLFMAAISAPFLIGSFLSHYFKYRSEVARRGVERSDEQLDLQVAELKAELETMRERIEVLEAIVTDGKYDLKLKIANL